MSQSGIEEHGIILQLLKPGAYSHGTGQVELIETHISWVILTGRIVYKIKKPVKLNFVDFRTLERRRKACIDELRLNKRLAPELYLQVVTIGGTRDNPVMQREPAIEYAVQMKQFPQEALLESQLEQKSLHKSDIVQAARMLADFHLSLEGAARTQQYGSPSGIFAPFNDTLADLAADIEEHCPALASRVQELHARFEPLFEARKDEGFIRECHGDLHLKNLIKLDGRIIAFDCLEFSATLRWIDVISEIAFLFMDLLAHRAKPFAYRFVNEYLQQTGDYAGLTLLHYYAGYHALVRAKVAKLSGDNGSDEKAMRQYLALGNLMLHRSAGTLIMTHGLSGSGKTTMTEPLIARLPAIRIRSDIERKRLARLSSNAQTHSGFAQGIYNDAGTRKTYRRLLSLAVAAAQAGCNVIIDAAFLKRWQRDLFWQAARQSNLRIAVLDVSAPEPVLRARVSERDKSRHGVSEATAAILDRQLGEAEGLQPDERAHSIMVNTEGIIDADRTVKQIEEKLGL